MTEKRTECSNCHYLIGYPDGKRKCLMKQEFCIVDGKTSYPRDCKCFKEVMWND